MPASDYIRQIRTKVGHDLLLMPSVSAMVFDAQGRLLLVKDIEAEAWVMPGGAVDPHEAPADAAVRETWEETGLLIEPIRIRGVYGGPDFQVRYSNGDVVSYLTTVFEGKVIGGKMRPDQVETLDVAYFSLADFSSIKISPWVNIVLSDTLSEQNRTHFKASTWQPPS